MAIMFSIGKGVAVHCYNDQSSVMIGSSAVIKQYVQLLAYPESDIGIGSNYGVIPFWVLYGLSGLSIGDNDRIATHTVIAPINHIFDDPDQFITSQGLTRSGVTIEATIWVGAGVMILDGCRNGAGSVVAAGGVVTKNVSPKSAVGGVPCELVSTQNRR